MRLVCDEMLKRLGQWLRVAGHDVLIPPDGMDDAAILAWAAGEKRPLLTRDRELAQRRSDTPVILLQCKDLDDCAVAVGRRLPIDWLYDPFSRCLFCNTPLQPADEQVLHRVPDDAAQRATRVRYCPTCDRVYWDGSHVQRMHERLLRWNAASH
ncbi:MAG: DUF5615 family PIN-like protein [Gammaproteobacteria bacterium]|nr:DUF5615 family PIN-like protein [Gammaproteobacteria bacterium]